MNEPQVLEMNAQRVLTTAQLAEAYEAEVKSLQKNFAYNRERFKEGKHYISLEGEALKEFKANHEISGKLKYAHILYLWTEKGALLHAKSLNTDKAWEVYDWLVDFYFRARDEVQEAHNCPVPRKSTKVKSYKIPEMSDPILIFRVLLKMAEENGISVRSFPLPRLKSCLHDKNIGIDEKLSLREINYELAYELAHAIVHYDGGDIINSHYVKNMIRMLNE